MKGTEIFTEIISTHLEQLAQSDPLFAMTLQKPNKNIQDCINYILNTVQKNGCNGLADQEVFGMAVHYYDEDDIKPVASTNVRVVVNHTVKNDNLVQKIAPAPEEKKAVKKANKKQVSDLQPSLFS